MGRRGPCHHILDCLKACHLHHMQAKVGGVQECAASLVPRRIKKSSLYVSGYETNLLKRYSATNV